MAANDLKMLSGSFHVIPSGRQLPRTPPLTAVKKRLDFSIKEEQSPIVASRHNAEGDSRDPAATNLLTFNASDTKPGFAGYADSLVNGMKGYRLTAADLDFMRMMQVGKRVKQLQGMLEVLQKDVKVLENVQADLEELIKHQQQLFGALMSSVKGFELEFESLLATLTQDGDKQQQQAVNRKKKTTNRKKVDTKEREQLAEQFGGGQVQEIMREWSELKCKVAQLELARREAVPPVAAWKAGLPTGRKAANKDTRASKAKGQKSPTKATIPKAAAGPQIVSDQSKPAGGATGRPKAARRAKAAASQAQSAKLPQPIGTSVKRRQGEEIVLRRSKRIADRHVN
ncbi:uncharacterized protein LOC144053055 isoform X2 [Vanacampus margaritifer]